MYLRTYSLRKKHKRTIGVLGTGLAFVTPSFRIRNRNRAGCMAERLKERLLEKEGLVDVVAGPDAYR